MLFLKVLFKEIYHLSKSRESREFLKLAAQIGDEKRYTTRQASFLGYKFTVPDTLSFLWQFKEIFVDDSYLFRTTNPKPVIFDCGANVGTSCVYFKEKNPGARIVAFEADPTIAQVLQKNLEVNKLNNIEVISKAVWIHNDGITMSLDGSDAASIYATGAKTNIPSVRLRDLLLQEKEVDMLKMDIEGAEVEVIKDCRDALHHVQNVFIEYHAFVDQPQELDVLLTILRENNFRVYIKEAQERRSPLYNYFYKNNTTMDLQLNLFAYKIKNSGSK